MREAAADEAALLLEAARATPRRFARSPTTFIRGSTVTLGALWEDLTGRSDSDLKIDAMRHGCAGRRNAHCSKTSATIGRGRP